MQYFLNRILNTHKYQSLFSVTYTLILLYLHMHPSFKPPLVPESLSTGNDFLKNWQYDVTCTLPAWCRLMYSYYKSPRDPTPRWVQLLLFPEIRSTSIFWVIWGVKPLFVVQRRGDINPTEIMLGLAGGMKVNCYLKIIYM